MLVKSGSTSTCIMSVFQTVRAPAECLCVQRGHGQSNSCCPRLVGPDYQLGVPAVLSTGLLSLSPCQGAGVLSLPVSHMFRCHKASLPAAVVLCHLLLHFKKCAEGRAANTDQVCC